MFTEKSPRERTLKREMDRWINATSRPWDGRRVVAAMTTTPTRVSIIEGALDSLLRQSHPLDAMYLFIPHIFLRDQSTYEIPDWLRRKRGVTVMRCGDGGPATHMLEVLKVEREPMTYILQVDDDQEYGPELLVGLLRASGPLPGRAVCGATQHAHTHIGGIVLEGVHSVLFQRRFFDPGVFDRSGFPKECYLHDDLWLSAHLANRRIGRDALGSRFGTRALDYGYGADALYKGGAGSDNVRNFFVCMASLLRRYPRLWEPERRVVLVAPLLRRRADWSTESDASSAAGAWRTLRRLLRRRPHRGPQAVYLHGPPPARWLGEEAPHSWSWQGGRVVHLGGWGNIVDVVVRDCGSADGGSGTCGLGEALELALRFEEDPETIVMVLEQPILSSAGLERMVESHLDCYVATPSASERAPCRGPAGSTSFMRHAAYDVGRVEGGVFMPTFSQDFHAGRAEGTHLPMPSVWRDLGGQWTPALPDPRVPNYIRDLTARGGDDTVRGMLAGLALLSRRTVAALRAAGARGADLLRLGAVARSVLRQVPLLRRVHVFVPVRRQMRRCLPSWLGERFRLHIVCEPLALPASHILRLMDFEWGRGTFVLLCDDLRRYGPGVLNQLVAAADLFVGSMICAVGLIYGEYGGPVGALGAGCLLRRGMLDTGFRDLLVGDCAGHAELPLAAHLALKGVRTEVIGSNLGTWGFPGSRAGRLRDANNLLACRQELVRKHDVIWVSRFPERCVVFVALLDITDEFLLEMTIRYAGSQTRRPDEVVLLAMNGNILEAPPLGVQYMQAAEVELSGRIGDGTMAVKTLTGKTLSISLSSLLSARRNRSGLLVRMRQTGYGRERSFVLSVASVEPCPGGKCSIVPTLLRSFDFELHPETVLMFLSAERLANERVVAENMGCISACGKRCTKHNWCGQTEVRKDGGVYDLTVRRNSGYREHTIRY